MKLKDAHPDMERFLREDCRQPNEIRDFSKLFHDLYPPETECVVVANTDKATVVVAHGSLDEKRDRAQVIYFWHDKYGGSRIRHAERFDATDNNIAALRDVADDAYSDEYVSLDEYAEDETRSLEQILSASDGLNR